jgi:hypothetical protein
MLNPPNRHGTDPYAWWCGRGGVARCPPIPIDFKVQIGSGLPCDEWGGVAGAAGFFDWR